MKRYKFLATLLFGISTIYANENSTILSELKKQLVDINLKVVTDSSFLKKISDNTYLSKDVNSFSYILDNRVQYKNIKVNSLTREYIFNDVIAKSTVRNINFNVNAKIDSETIEVQNLKLKIPKSKCEHLIKVTSVDNLKKYAKCRKVEKVYVLSANAKLNNISFRLDNDVDNILTLDKNKHTLDGTLNIIITQDESYQGLIEFTNRSVNLKVDADKNSKFTSDEVIKIW